MPTYEDNPVISVSKHNNSNGVTGESQGAEGVRGISHSVHGGVVGVNNAALPGGNGGWFESEQGEGVRGWSKNANNGGVVGINTGNGIAVYGESDNYVGVWGKSVNSEGVHGESTNGEGVRGLSASQHGAVVGVNNAGLPGGNGGWFQSEQGEGVRGWSQNANYGGVVGVNTGGGIAVYGESDGDSGIGVYGKGGRLAGFFDGIVEVTVDIRLTNGDCAEDFNISRDAVVEPGTVMVLGDNEELYPSQCAYDKRVAGVISGAGSYKPGIVLDKQANENCNRQPIALLGKVYCKVDAQYGAIEVGDLLTTSSTPGHAMKACEPLQAFGAVIGKALRPMKEGQGLIPILIAL